MKGIGQILYDIEKGVIIFKSLDNNVRTSRTIYDVLCNFPVGLRTKVVLRDQYVDKPLRKIAYNPIENLFILSDENSLWMTRNLAVGDILHVIKRKCYPENACVVIDMSGGEDE